MQFQFVGCGDAFGSGGRFNTCFHVQGESANFLIDCGATSLVALKRCDVRLNDVQTILFTHFHADHFGGIPPLILDAQFFSKRKSPLTIAGPKGLKEHLLLAMETAYPGSSKSPPGFDLELIELQNGISIHLNGMTVNPFTVNHGTPGGPFFAYRIETAGRVIAYSGDTEWVDCLTEVGRNADLFVAEAYFRDKQVPLHLDLATLEKHLPEIEPKRLVLTHMSEDMLAQRDSIAHQCAEDGMVIAL